MFYQKFATLVAAFALISSNSAAQDPPLVTIPPGDDVIVAVEKGAPSPIRGQVFSPETATRWANWLGQYKLRLRADLDYQKKVDQADLTLAQTMLQIEKDKYKAVTEDYQQRAAQQQARIEALEAAARNPPLLASPWFGFALGVAGTTLAVGLGAFALHAAK
jgi:hypothetical protein